MSENISTDERASIEQQQAAICGEMMDVIANIITSAQVRMMRHEDPVHQERLISLAQASSRRVAAANNCAAVLLRSDEGELLASCSSDVCQLRNATVG